jgi:hypothetical protein
VTSTRPPGGHDCRTVGPPSCLSRPPPSALAGRGRCTSFATARSPTPPRLAPTPPPSWPTPGTLRSLPGPLRSCLTSSPGPLASSTRPRHPAALNHPRRPHRGLGRSRRSWTCASPTAPWCGYGSPSAWTRCRSRRACPFSRRATGTRDRRPGARRGRLVSGNWPGPVVPRAGRGAAGGTFSETDGHARSTSVRRDTSRACRRSGPQRRG